MTHTRYSDPTGLSPDNVSTASDLAILVNAAAQQPLIREFTTTGSHYVEVQPTGRLLGFNNTNNLVKSAQWDIQLSKTGYIREAGKCLVMMATIASRPFVIVLLDSAGKYTRLGDAQRVRYWLETGQTMPMPTVHKAAGKAAKTKGPVTGSLRPVKFAQSKAPAAEHAEPRSTERRPAVRCPRGRVSLSPCADRGSA